MLEIYTNQAITVVYKVSSHQSSTSSSDYNRQRKINWQHQQDEAPGVPLISGMHRPPIRARLYVDEENESQYGSSSDDGSKIDNEDNDFQPHNNYASDKEDKNEQDGVV